MVVCMFHCPGCTQVCLELGSIFGMMMHPCWYEFLVSNHLLISNVCHSKGTLGF